jgi:hypothetical protein
MNKNTIVDYVGRLRTKPEHVRRRIALGTAIGTTGVIAAAWLFVLVSSGSLLIPATPAPGTSALAQNGAAQVQSATAQTQSGFQQLLGAVGFASATTAQPSLTIVNTASSSNSGDSSSDGSATQSPTGGDQTIIPF